ncbi:MAG TPA: hypothetical protein VGA71_03455 [Actinomycetota bacterium]
MTASSDSPPGSRLLVGVDDTDNLESKGTGNLAQRLVEVLREAGLGSASGVTRHQLLVDPRIPYTSHNSSACIAWNGKPGVDADAIALVAGPFLETASARGSDPGLAIAAAASWSDPRCRHELVDWGRRAKHDVLDRSEAVARAAACAVSLSAHGGDGGGVIGALAALGLHQDGDDGRFLWMPGLRDLAGRVTYDQLRSRAPIDVARDPAGQEPKGDDIIDLGEWVRPVLRESRSVLLLAARPGGVRVATWTVLPRDAVKAL